MKTINNHSNWGKRNQIKRIRINDKVIAKDTNLSSGLRGEILFGRGKKIIHYTDPYGRPATRLDFEETYAVDHNIVVIGGYQYAFCKMFNIGLDQESTLRVGHLNDEAPLMKIGVQRSEYNSIYYDSECSINNSDMIVKPGVNIPATNYIFGFMMGDGGAREDNITPIAPDYKNRTLNRAIPFRMSNDGSNISESKYFGKTNSFQSATGMDPITSYYIKKFDDPAPHIVHVWVTDNPNELEIVDDTVFASTSSLAIESYVEMSISIDQYDGRGFFTSVETSPRVNEFGLVSGWYNPLKNDYEAIALITKFSRPSIALSEGDSIEAIYRLYAR